MQNIFSDMSSGSASLRSHALAGVLLGAFSLAANAAAQPSADGWQELSATAPTMSGTVAISAQAAAPTLAAPTPAASAATSLAVTPVVLPGSAATAGAALTLAITPQDVNLRNAMDRWLQTQGWQLAWKVDDDLPLQFNASFSGDFTSVLRQVMQATNYMRTPARICRHPNNVIRVIARAASCKE